MGAVVLPTARLELVLQTPDETLAFVEAMSPEDRAEVSPDWLARVRATPEGDPWALSFSVVERAVGAAVGSCAFKGPPDSDGVVEVAYGIDPSHRCRGYATEATGALTEFAFTDDRVRLVRAHARPENGPSARVLEKCGFGRVGEVIDLEDGLVSRWERARKTGKAPASNG